MIIWTRKGGVGNRIVGGLPLGGGSGGGGGTSTPEYSTPFSTTDWVGATPDYSITIPATTHLQPITKTLLAFIGRTDLSGVNHSIVTDYTVDDAGTVTIYSSEKFVGTVVIGSLAAVVAGSGGGTGIGVVGGILYFREGAGASPVMFDLRIIKDVQYCKIQRFNGNVWEDIGIFGGSILSDKFIVKYSYTGAINEIAYQAEDGHLRQIWGLTGEPHENSYGDSDYRMYLTANARDGLRTSYPGVANTASLNADYSQQLTGAVFSQTFTALTDWQVLRILHKLYTPTKARLMVKTAVGGVFVYKSMGDAEFAATGGVLLKDELTQAETGDVNVLLKGNLYLRAGVEYEVTIETSQSGYLGNVVPFTYLSGVLDMEETIATREWVDEQPLIGEEVTLKKNMATPGFGAGDYKITQGENDQLHVDAFDAVTQDWTTTAELGIHAKHDNLVLAELGVLALEKAADGYEAKICGRATSDNSISFGDPNRTFIGVSGSENITCLINPVRGIVTEIQNLFDENQAILEYSFLTPAVTLSSSITKIAIKLLDSITDYQLKAYNISTGVYNYYSKTDLEYHNGFSKQPFAPGAVELKSNRPFWILPNNQYRITIKFPALTRVLGHTVGVDFMPYSVITLDQFTRDELITKSKQALLSNEVTGWIKGAALTVNALDNTKFDIAPGKVQLVDYPVDPDAPTKTLLSWSVALVSSAGVLGTNRSKWVGLRKDINGALEIVIADSFSPIDRRGIAVLGRIRNSSGAGPIITNMDSYENPTWGVLAAFQDYMMAKGSFSVSGNTLAPTNALRLTKLAGSSWRYHAEDTYGSENIHSDPVENPRTTYSYIVNGLNTTIAKTSLDPLNYTVGTTVTALSNNSKFSKQELYIFPVSGSWMVVYGVAEYSSLADAIAAEPPQYAANTLAILEGSYHAASIVMIKATTDLAASIAANNAKLIPIIAGVSAVPMSIPGIYVGATPTTNGVTGTVPAAVIADRDKAFFGDGTYKTVLAPTTANTFIGENVFTDTKFTVAKLSDATANFKLSAANVPTATTNTYDLPPTSGRLALLSEIPGVVVTVTLSERILGSKPTPPQFTPVKYHATDLNKILLYRLVSLGVSEWFEDDGDEEYLYGAGVPVSPAGGNQYTSPRGKKYTYDNTNMYWVRDAEVQLLTLTNTITKTVRDANTTPLPQVYAPTSWYDTTLNKSMLYRRVSQVPAIYAWMENDGIAEKIDDFNFPQTPTNGTVYTATRSKYTYDSANTYWALTGRVNDKVTTCINVFKVAASTSGMAGLNVPAGVAVSAPTDGDIWYSGNDLMGRFGGRTVNMTNWNVKKGFDLTASTFPTSIYQDSFFISGVNNQAIQATNASFVFENIDKAEVSLPYFLQKLATFFKNLENDIQFDQLIGLHPSWYNFPFGNWFVVPSGSTDMDNATGDGASNTTSTMYYSGEYFELIVGRNVAGTEIYTMSFNFAQVGNAAWDGAKLYPFRMIYQNVRGSNAYNWSGTLVSNGASNGIPKCTARANGWNPSSSSTSSFPIYLEPIILERGR